MRSRSRHDPVVYSLDDEVPAPELVLEVELFVDDVLAELPPTGPECANALLSDKLPDRFAFALLAVSKRVFNRADFSSRAVRFGPGAILAIRDSVFWIALLSVLVDPAPGSAMA